MRRVLMCHGAVHLRINRYNKGAPHQKFYYDAKTKTIRSNHWKNYAMQITGNGSSSTVRMTSGITSRWW
jgi:hypothetical protein